MHLVLSDLQSRGAGKMLGVAGRSFIGRTKQSIKCCSAETE